MKLPEHSNLALDVTPLAGSLEIMGQGVVKLLTHADDTVGHSFDLTLPLGIELGVAEDGVGDAGAIGRRIRVHGADDDLELAVDASLLFGIGSYKGEGTNALAVKSHVLSERLGDGYLVSLGHKVAHGKGITTGRARGEALVGHVEEGEELLLLNDVGDFNPLGLGRVDTCGVVCAGMEENNSALRSRLQTRIR